ncbi:Pyridoxine/pyridoxamine 5'-phosphate oxidase [Candidatus Hartigia pinicola]|nr:Pyridoxine/pyridoxamine 5'-phosphate oxidase [Candidatus Hartigia pinicola]
MNIAQDMNLSVLHREYNKDRLRRVDLTPEPVTLFASWLKQAFDANVSDPTAMSVATVDKTGQPYQRAVLLKFFDEKGLIFYTNMMSRKAQHLYKNNKISVHFSWYELERQVNFLGVVECLNSIEVIKYFHSRPRDNQIAAWASQQSLKISDRSILEGKFLEFKQIFHNKKIPLPSFWGGFRIVFNNVEFWQGRATRLHDRFVYQREKYGWKIDRLAP